MDRFDDLITRGDLRLAHAQAHLAAGAGAQRLMGRYYVAATAGTTGEPGIFVWDVDEWADVLASYSRAYSWAGASVRLTTRTRMAVVSSTSPPRAARRRSASSALPWTPPMRMKGRPHVQAPCSLLPGGVLAEDVDEGAVGRPAPERADHPRDRLGALGCPEADAVGDERRVLARDHRAGLEDGEGRDRRTVVELGDVVLASDEAGRVHTEEVLREERVVRGLVTGPQRLPDRRLGAEELVRARRWRAAAGHPGDARRRQE